MEINITLEREPGAPTAGIYSENPNIFVVRDAGVSDRDLLVAYADALEFSREESAAASG
jgi:hypothetical protein